MTLQILGLCRFSYLGIGGFQTPHQDLEAARAFLYDPARLEHRFAWFEQVCLPAMKAQTDKDFRFLVLTGVDLPEWALLRLETMLQDFPQAELVLRQPRNHREACRTTINTAIDPAATAVAQFRMDDDDAVAVDFVARLRADYTHLIAPMAAHLGLPISLDYCRGLTLAAAGTGLAVYGQVVSFHPAGLVLFTAPGDPKTVMNYGHHRMMQHMPVLTLTDQVMYLRGYHRTNDSGGYERFGLMADPPEGTETALLAARFAIDLEHLRTMAPLLAAPMAALGVPQSDPT